jgi:hypothetical protein
MYVCMYVCMYALCLMARCRSLKLYVCVYICKYVYVCMYVCFMFDGEVKKPEIVRMCVYM